MSGDRKVVTFDAALSGRGKRRGGRGGAPPPPGGGGGPPLLGPDDWRHGLQRSATGTPKANLRNVALALRRAPELQGAVAYDEMRQTTRVVRPLPWDDRVGRDWEPHDDLACVDWLNEERVQAGRDLVEQGVELVAWENRVHPVRELLSGLVWDGVARLDQWLTYYLGVEASPYVREVGRRWLISAVARIYQPGCKADHMLVLEGKQGLGKSQVAKALAMQPDWFADELAELGSKDSALQTIGVWIIEVAELEAVNGSQVASIKAFLTRTTDRFRPPFGRRVIEAARQCVFVGTCNEAQYLRDGTGNRRFWPVRVQSIDIAALRADVLQLWAEAVGAYRAGEPWWLTDETILAAAEDEQEQRASVDPWLDLVATHVGGLDRVKVEHILRDVIKKPEKDWARVDQMRLAACLQDLGWVRRRDQRQSGVRQRGWHYVRDTDQAMRDDG